MNDKTKTWEYMEYIQNNLPYSELLAQLAEECCELAQASLKYRRVLDKTNPTPVEEQDAIDHLLEEAADVYGCLRALNISVNDLTPLLETKFKRWVRRLGAR